jgi:hypothetical protein
MFVTDATEFELTAWVSLASERISNSDNAPGCAEKSINCSSIREWLEFYFLDNEFDRLFVGLVKR